MTHVVITMAGFGRRFLDAGYDKPKYQIEAHGRTLFAWSMISLRDFARAGAAFTFVVRAADQTGPFIRNEARALGLAINAVVELDAPTDGQATTVMKAADRLEPAAPLLIYNIDTFVHPDALPARAIRGDGWIPCFAAQGDAWSFAAADETGRVSEVREKRRISPHATIGLYYFSSLALYGDIYERHYADPRNLEKGERYVAPLYNTLISDGGAVYIHDVPGGAVIPLGTPSDVDSFRARAPPRL